MVGRERLSILVGHMRLHSPLYRCHCNFVLAFVSCFPLRRIHFYNHYCSLRCNILCHCCHHCTHWNRTACPRNQDLGQLPSTYDISCTTPPKRRTKMRQLSFFRIKFGLKLNYVYAHILWSDRGGQEAAQHCKSKQNREQNSLLLESYAAACHSCSSIKYLVRAFMVDRYLLWRGIQRWRLLKLTRRLGG